MRHLLLGLLLIGVAGCSLGLSDDDQVLVRVRNKTEVPFTQVVLDLGPSDAGRAVFRGVPPGSLTRFRGVRQARSQPFTVRAQSRHGEFVFNLEAVAPLPLDPGRHTYVLTLDEENHFFVERGE